MLKHICVENNELIGYDHHCERRVLDPGKVEAVYYGRHIIRNHDNGELTVVIEASIVYYPQFSSIPISEADRVEVIELLLLNKGELKYGKTI